MSLFGPPNIDKLAAKKDIAGLAKALCYGKTPNSTRYLAADALVTIGPAAVDALVAVLEAPEQDEDCRTAAVQALGRIGDRRAVAPLIAALPGARRDLSRSIVDALGKIGGPEASAALAAAVTGSPRVESESQVAAVRWLGRQDPPPIVQLVNILKKGWLDKNVQAALMETVVGIGAPAVGLLETALFDRQITGGNEPDLAKALAAIGAPAYEALLRALRADGEIVRSTAAEALGRLGGEDAIAGLVAALKDSKYSVRKAAAKSLQNLGWQPPEGLAGFDFWFATLDWERCSAIGAPAIPMLVTAAREDEDETTRRGAVLALAKMEPLAGVAALLEVVKTGKDSQTRTAAYDQIRYLGQAAVPALLEALDDPVPVHRSTVAELLDRRWTPGNDANAAAYWLAKGDLKRAVELGPVAIEPMIAILRSNSATRWFEYVSALASFPVQAEGPLIAALSEPGFLGRELVCMALGKIAHRRSVPPLIATLNDDNWHVRRAAIGALGAIGDQSAVPVLIDLLQDDSSTIRASAAGELASFLNPQAVEPLCRSLQDSSPAVRAAAARTLGRHGDTRAVEPLCTLLAQVAAGDEEESARVDVAEALGRLGDRQALPVLQTAAQTDPSGRVRRQAETAIDLLKKSKRRK